MKLKNILFTFSFCVFGSQLMAQDIEIDSDSTNSEPVEFFEMSLEELLSVGVSVGSKTMSSVEETPGTVYLIEREDIEKSNAQNLGDILNLYVPGLDATPTYFKYGNSATGIYNRGTLSDFNQQVLILWNGENKFNDATFGSPHLYVEYPIDNIEKIEINSSSPSPLLGGSAMMTVNIVTMDKTAEETTVRVNTGISPEEGLLSKRVSASFGETLGSWRLGGAMQYFDDKGFKYQPEGAKTNASAEGLRNGNKGSVSMQFNLQNTDKNIEFGSSYRNINKDAFLSSLSFSESSDIYKYQGVTFMNYINYKPIEGLEISSGYSQMNFNNYVDLEQFIPVGVNQTEKIPYGINITNNDFYLQSNLLRKFNAAGSHTLLSGIRFEAEGQTDHSIYVLNEDNIFEDQTNFRSSEYGVSIPNLSRSIYTVFAEDNWELNDKLNALIAVRADIYNNYNKKSTAAINPRLGLTYKASDKLYIKGLFATAVRPPSIYEIAGSKFLPLLYGNNEIGLEKLNTYELNVVYKTETIKASLTGYLSQFKDRISYTPSALDTTISTANNVGQTNITGIEFNVEYKLNDDLKLLANGAQVLSKDNDTDETTPFVASTYFNTGIFYTIGKVDVIATSNFRGAREIEENIQTGEVGQSFFNLNLSFRYNVSDMGYVYVQAQNLLDNSNLIPLSVSGYSYPINARLIHLGFQYKF